MPASPEAIAIIPANDKTEARELAPVIAGWLARNGRKTVTEAELNRGAHADMILALGGDGLLMHMAHTYPGVPILGVNFGTVGFLAMVERAYWKPTLETILAGDFRYQDGPTLDISLRRGREERDKGLAINDVVIRSGLRMIDTELYVDQRYVNTYPGDGMIVATPQGSTAYCMAAGGPILTAGVRGFAVTPISPHSPIRATFVVPEESLIELVVANERPASLILDGEEVTVLEPRDVVVVRQGSKPFRMVMLDGMNFYDAFRSKFNYLIRPDATPTLGIDRQ